MEVDRRGFHSPPGTARATALIGQMGISALGDVDSQRQELLSPFFFCPFLF